MQAHIHTHMDPDTHNTHRHTHTQTQTHTHSLTKHTHKIKQHVLLCRLEFYGVELFPARDHHGVELGLGITCNGISVFKDKLLITTFGW